MPSASSANADSSVSSGLASLGTCVGVCDERNELRDGGLSGVVGRGGGVPDLVLETERFRDSSKFVGVVVDMLSGSYSYTTGFQRAIRATK